MDRRRKGSNDAWTHPRNPDSKVTKMKDRGIQLAHKVECVVALETEVILGMAMEDVRTGDTNSMQATLPEAIEQFEPTQGLASLSDTVPVKRGTPRIEAGEVLDEALPTDLRG